jgi:Mg-chelatase subunit ChlD
MLKNRGERHFAAELTVMLTDGQAVTECFNQAEMAHFMRENMLAALGRGESLVVFDGERREIDAQRVASVQVTLHDVLPV